MAEGVGEWSGKERVAAGGTRIPRLRGMWTGWPARFLPHKGTNQAAGSSPARFNQPASKATELRSQR